MHFKTIKRDKILPMIEQAKDKKEQKSILCDLLQCKPRELEELIKELENERAANVVEPAPDIKSGKWEDSEIEQLKKLRDRGLGSGEIAKKLGRLQKSVISKLSELKKHEEQYELCEDNDDASDKELAKKVAENDELAAISAYANELQARLKEKEAKIAALEKTLDASTAAEESLKNCRELLLKYDKKISVLSEALSKALAFIASLNGVIADALKV